MKFSHLDDKGEVRMVGISHKNPTHRRAVAQATIIFPHDVYQHILAHDKCSPKGSISTVAHIAGIMGAKKTADLIPLCHPLSLEKCTIECEFLTHEPKIIITASCELTHKTGVEMEALTAVSVAALSVYDMCKALSHQIIINEIKLVTKTGGKTNVQY